MKKFLPSKISLKEIAGNTTITGLSTNWKHLVSLLSVQAVLLLFTVNRANAQCIPFPEANNSSCNKTLIATGLAPGGQGSNSSGVLALDGSSQYLQTGINTLPSTAITIEYWFKGTNLQSAVRQQSGPYLVAGWSNPPTHIFSDDGGSGNGIRVDATGNSVIYNGQWHHVAMTWQQNTVNGFCSYLDGVLQQQRNSANVTIPNMNTPLLIGRYSGGGEYTNGNLDNIRIWSVARTQAQIQADMFLETPSNATGLFAHFKLNGDYTCVNNAAFNASGINTPGFVAPNCYTYTWTGTNAPAPSTNESQSAPLAAALQSYSCTASFSTYSNCSGTPNSTTIGYCSNAVANPALLRTGGVSNLTLTNYGTGAIQWQQSADGTSGWANVSGGSGANTNSYTTGTLTTTTYYRAVVTGGTQPGISNIISVTIPQYCTPTANTGNTCTYLWITRVAIVGTNFSNVSGCNAPYNKFAETDSTTATLLAGSTYQIGLSDAYPDNRYFGNPKVFSVWIDANQNGIFETSEQVVTDFATNVYATKYFTVPANALAGPTRMRVREDYMGSTTLNNPCQALSYGETEDYTIHIQPVIAASPDKLWCSGGTTSLSISNYLAGDVQWQVSTTNSPYNWLDVSGANSSAYTTGAITATTYYRAVITDGGIGDTSNTVTISVVSPTGMAAISGTASVTVNGTTALCASNPTGGTVSTYGPYRIHTFTSSGVLAVPAGFSNGTVEVLVVGGGGGGGSDMGGGGGGGAVVYQSGVSLTPGSMAVTVGAGGTGAPAGTGQVRGGNGSSSVFGSITAIGGGGGASIHNTTASPAGNGSSGGGASGAGGIGGNGGVNGTGTPGLGYNGGMSIGTWYPGGGGGAGGPGITNPATGGPGVANAILGTNYYWGGGGGGAGYTGIGGNGGIGGGGGGAIGVTTGGAGYNNGLPGGGGGTSQQANMPGGNAGANTGGGGGGGAHYTINNYGGTGGSGIVVVRYVDVTAIAGTWSSDNTSVATVNPATGVVTGVSAGTANIIYTAQSGSCSSVIQTVAVTVTAASVNLCVNGKTTASLVVPDPTGGTITTVGGYRIHSFTSNGTFVVPTGFIAPVDVLVVGGGGGGGSDMGGGGGGGGVVYRRLSLSPGSFPVTIGAGGAGAPAGTGQVRGFNGGNSTFSTVTALGGGGGASIHNTTASPAGNGGSGGGASGAGGISGYGGTYGTGTPGQGFNGGGSTGTWYPGGGGGAGGAGSTAPANGGPGIANAILGTTYYWGGGGGGAGYSGRGGIGGIGGGGGGAIGPDISTANAGGVGINNGMPGGLGYMGNQSNVPGGDGGANTGGGGGGGAHYNIDNNGGKGGSGIVVIRYALPTWSSSNPAVATVDSAGVITGVAPGTASISYTVYTDGCPSVQSIFVTVSSSAVGSISNTTPGVCNGSGTTITLTGNSGTTVQWQQSANGSTGWADVTGGTGATSTSYTTANLTALTYFRALATSGCTGTSAIVAVSVTPTPPNINYGTASPQTVSVNGTSTLCVASSIVPTGGIITTSGGYRTHTFTSSGTFTAPAGFSANVEILMVGGGGGGGSFGGGGGGGGVVYNNSFAVGSGSFPVYVGKGGSPATQSDVINGNGQNGDSSTFSSLIAYGGGGGATRRGSPAYDGPAGNRGASGGGGANSDNTTGGAGGTAISGQGYPGGAGGTGNTPAPSHAHGGGGGAGGPGMDGRTNGTRGASGGIGLQFPQFASLGGSPAGWFGGGGNGGIYTNGTLATAVNGGGGLGGDNQGRQATSGTVNTGGGGGGGSYNGAGGTGGSGVVIIRYLDLTTYPGTWSSDNTTVATVNPSTGMVTGVSAGTANIIYSVQVGSCTLALQTVPFTVTPAIPALCVNGKTTGGITVPTYTAPTGGTVTTSGNYIIHKFTSNGVFNVATTFNSPVEVLVVAGGGGGGGASPNDIAGGGGGGGGVVYNPAYSITGTTAVTVGAGGLGGVNFSAGTNGGNSSFGALSALGGGYGGSWQLTPTVGGSGGGAGENGQGIVGALGTAGQGYKGGDGNVYVGGNASAGGGGGGAGGPGANQTGNVNGGAGGVGALYSITGAPVYYAGGGGGGGFTSAGVGGLGGGGNGRGVNSNNGYPGTANTGGGGGGALASNYDGNYTGGNGGSGVVIIRYVTQTTTWVSSNPAVATVDTNGVITGIAPGTSTITCTITNPSCTIVKTVVITVNSSQVGTVAATPSAVCEGSTSVLSLTGNSGSSIQWESSNNALSGWANVTGGSGANSASYTSSTLTGTTYFRVQASGLCSGSTAPVAVTVTPTPPAYSYSAGAPISLGVNSTMALCGIPSAPTGGTVTTQGGYRIHTFTNSGTFTTPTGFDANVEVLVVAGGGGGGQTIAGGGGGGGVVYNSSFPLTAQAYPVTVGAGGLGKVSDCIHDGGGGQPGGNSVFSTITAVGGGAGGSYNNSTNGATSGGSGGGIGAGASWGAMPGTSGQGFAGGISSGNSNDGGGGGGAGGAGTNGTNGVAGNGGPGVAYAISGTLTYYGGGGGGGARNPNGNDPGAGGIGGGGNGGFGSGAGGNAPANSGSGGGGGGYQNTGAICGSGGNGGSGIVIIKYPDLTVGSWISENPAIATVNSTTGLVTAIDTGTTNIKYVSYYGACQVALKTYSVTVTPELAPICIQSTRRVSSVLAPQPATGGNVSIAGGYRIHTFTSNGTFTVPTNFSNSADVLVVAGGGGGGSDMGGGGGGGGVIYRTAFNIAAGDIPVTVGAGGTGAPAGISQLPGTKGGNSVFSTLTAIGGGGGGSEYSNNSSPASSGGSGGGAAGCNNPTPGAGTSGQGFSGAGNGGCYYPGGGGGAGGVGLNNPATGGPGVANSILGTTYYWGGGGGGAGHSSAGGNGGIGGGGGGAIGPNSSTATTGGAGLNNGSPGGIGPMNSTANVPGGNGGANTGGGGGGGSHYNANNYGGNGGSGIVIVRYPYITGTWASSNPAIATVDSTGNVTGVSAGTATITYTIVNGSCTSVQTTSVTISNLTIGTASTTIPSVCSGGTSTLTLTGNSAGGIQWQESSNGNSGFVNVTAGSGATTTSYTTPVLTASTYYRVRVTGSCIGNTEPVLIAVTPQAPAITYGTANNTSISINGTATLCGITTPTGGTISTNGGYRIHTFTNNGIFTAPSGFNANVEVLLVGGGGGGGETIGGGGGGGGVVYNPSFAVTPQIYPVLVGAGGLGTPSNCSNHANGGGARGSNTLFSSLIAYGGGGGGNFNDVSNGATSGASGGGIGAGNNAAAMAGTSGQGNTGGRTSSNQNDGAGGGGAGTAGGNATNGVAGNGGDGIAISITGTPVYYGGGGGGGSRNPGGSFPGVGGNGGGGAGGYGPAAGTNGTANTGGGGGGGGYFNNTNTCGAGGNGGSGIVIIKYPDITAGTWSSDNTAVATVDANTGTVTGITAGTANITYSSMFGSCKVVLKTYPITVTPLTKPICVNGTASSGITVPASPPAATGGNVTTVDGYRIHRFTTSGIFAAPNGFNSQVEVLVVGGGGGGGGGGSYDVAGGGGGGGGLVYNSAYTVTPGDLNVVVGTGGTGGTGFTAGSNGGNSAFGSITAIGGGYGGSWQLAPTVGGSGGGAGENGQSLIAAAGTTGQGFGGGNGNVYIGGNAGAGGGGGGAGSPGYDQTGNVTGGNGGGGLAYPITGSTVYYAGGGGGSGHTTGGTGGIGGGGNGRGGTSGNGTAGGLNTGGGGGGAITINGDPSYTGGTGGSGVVVVRYASPITTWSSSNTAVATVDTAGVITGVSAGTATITCSINYAGCLTVQTIPVVVSSTSIGTATTATPAVCMNGTADINIPGTGSSTVQWQQSQDGATNWFSAIGGSGATTPTYTTPTLTDTIYYRAETVGTCDAYSNVVPVIVLPAPTITLGTSPTVAGGSTTANLPYTGITGDADQYTLTYDGAAQSAGFTDLALTVLSSTPIVLSIPSAAASGTYNGIITVSNSAAGCASIGVPFTVTILSGCPGTNPGNTLSTAYSVDPAAVFTLSLSNIPAPVAGVTYQWQSSTDNITYTNLSGATSLSLTTTQTVTTWYRCIATCTSGGATGTSTPVQISACSVPAHVQNVVAQPFPNATLPAGYTNTVIQGTQGWTFRNSPAMTTPSGNYYAVFDDNALGAGVTPNEAALVTAPINFLNRYNITLSYYTYWFGVENTHGYVEISNDGGTTWNLLKQYEITTVGSLGAPVQEFIDISAYANNQCNVKVRFRYTDGNQAGRFWYIDDVNIYGAFEVGITSLLAPTRLGCSASYGVAQSVTVRIQNYSLDPVSNVPLTCLVTGGTTRTLTGTYTGTIPALGFVDYTFTNTINMSVDSDYNFKVFTQLANDSYRFNDTLLDGRHQLVTNYTFQENFNGSNGGWFTGSTGADTTRYFAWGSLPYLNGPEGRGNSFYMKIPTDGWTGDLWVESPVFNLTGLSNPILSMDIKSSLIGNGYNGVQVYYTTNGGTSWTLLGNNTDPNWYNPNTSLGNNDGSAAITKWTRVQHSLCNLIGQTCVKFRLSTYNTYYSGSNAYFAFDNVKIQDAVDVAATKILAPVNSKCLYSATQPAQITVFNTGCTPVSNIPVSFVVSGATSTTLTGVVPGPIAGNSSANFTFSSTFNMSGIGAYNFATFTRYVGDANAVNDTAATSLVTVQPKISSFPYLQDFNTDRGYWISTTTPGDTNRRFNYGTVPYLGGAQGRGNSLYLTVPVDGWYGDVWAESPVFDFSNNTDPQLSMDIKYNIMPGSNSGYDRITVQYTTDGGTNWYVLGTGTDPNWYVNTPYTSNSWANGTNSTWTTVHHDLCNLSGLSCVKFRIATSDLYYSGTNAQFALDNFWVSAGGKDDIRPLEVIIPHSGNCGVYTNAEPVSVIIQNNTCRPLSNVPVSLQMTGAGTATLNEVMPGPIPGLGRYVYTFTGTVNMTGSGVYNMSVTTSCATDTFGGNNNRVETLNSNIPVASYPYVANYNAGNDGWVSRTNSNGSRLFRRDSVPYLNGAQSNGNSWFMDVPYDGWVGDLWVESPNFNLAGLSNPILSMDIKAGQIGNGYNGLQMQYSTNGGQSWALLGNNTDPNWYNPYTSFGNNDGSPLITNWKKVQHSLGNLLGQTCVKFRVLTYNMYYGGDNARFAFDNFVIQDAVDVGVSKIVGPVVNGCVYSATQQATITVFNYGVTPVSNIPVTFVVSGTTNQVLTGVVPGPIAGNSSVNYTFSGTYDMSAIGTYTLTTFTDYLGDANNANDTVVSANMKVTQVKVNTYPYLVDFDANNGQWQATTTPGDTNRRFTYGTIPYLGGPQGHGNAFYLVAPNDGWYGDVWVESPVFDLSTNTDPQLSMDIKYNIMPNSNSGYDRITVQYSTDGGSTWAVLGAGTDPNWYVNTPYTSNSWANGTQSTWKTVHKDLCGLSGLPCVKFRIATSDFYYCCTNAQFAFDNFRISAGGKDDLMPLEVVLPHSGNCGVYTAAEPVSVIIQNNTCRPLSNIPVTLQMTGAGTGTLNEVMPGPIPGLGRYLYTFTGTLSMNTTGVYNLQVTTSAATDTFAANNSRSETLNSNIPINTYPYLADYNAGNGGWVSRTNSNGSRLFRRDTIPYLNGAQGKGNSWYMDVPYDGWVGDLWVESPNFNLAGLSNPIVSLDIKAGQIGNGYNGLQMQYSLNGGQSWNQLGVAGEPQWYNPYTSFGNNDGSPNITEWKTLQHSLGAMVGQTCVKFRVLTYNMYYGGTNARFAFDNFVIKDAIDVAASRIVAPAATGCLYSATQQAQITVFNFGVSPVSNVPVSFVVSGAVNQVLTGTVPGPIPGNGSVNYTFATPFNMSGIGTYNFAAFTSYAPDANALNDTVYSAAFNVTQPKISVYPYTQNFDTSSGYWMFTTTPGDTNRRFTYGAVPYLGGAQGRGNSVYLRVPNDGWYGDVWAESPVFNLSGLTNPVLSMDIKYNIMPNSNSGYDRVTVQYSTDGGVNWAVLGTGTDPQWYNNQPWAPNSWSNGTNATWTNIQHTLCNLAGQSCVKFRISTSDLYYCCTNAQFAFDNFRITNSPLDAELVSIDGCYGSTYHLDVSVRNKNNFCISTPNITSVNLSYSLNGAPPVTNTYTGLNIAAGQAQTISIPNILVPDNTASIKVWCTLPNGIVDQLVNNDTLNANPAVWAPCNDHCVNAIQLNNRVTLASQNLYATADGAEDPTFSGCAGNGVTVENTVWYYFISDCSGNASVTFKNINCSPTPSGVQISIDRLKPGFSPCLPSSYTNVFCSNTGNDNDIVWSSSVTPNSTFYIAIDGVAGNQCTFQIIVNNLRDSIAPAASVSVQNDSTCYGTQKTLRPVGGTSGETGTWVWYANAACTMRLDTGSVYTVNPLAATTNYWVRAETNCDTTTATMATVTVLQPPAITTQPVSDTICELETTSFSVTVSSMVDVTYQWQISTNSGSSYTNITAPGTDPVFSDYTTSQLSLTNTSQASNGYMFRCVVTNVCDDTISQAATLRVNTLPSVTLGTDPRVCYSTNVQTASLTYSNAVATPNRYSIVWNPLASTAGFTDITDTTLTPASISIAVPASVSPGIYTGALSVLNTATGCETTIAQPVNVIVNNIPTAYNVVGGACVPAIMGLSNSDVGVSYQLLRNSTIPVGSAVAGTGAAIDFGVQNVAGIYSVEATNVATGCKAPMTGVSTVAICTITWIGVTSNDWFTSTNWDPAAVPNICAANVVIPFGTPHDPVISGAQNVQIGNMNIDGGVTLLLQGRDLNVCGNWYGGADSNAVIIGSGTTYINGTGAQTINGHTRFGVLGINNGSSNSVTVQSNADVSIITGVHLQRGNLDVVQGGILRLLSPNANTNSYVDDFTLSPVAYTGTLTGNIIADRYIPIKGYNQHFVSSPVNSPALAQVNASGPDGSYVLPTANCDENNSGLHTPYGSCFVYNDGYRPNGYCMLGNWMVKSAGNMENGKGYSIYLTGNSTLSLTGEANTGSVAIGGLNNSGYDSVQTLQGQWIESGWNLVGNPYPSAIDMTRTRVPDGFQNQVQLWVTSGPFSGSWQPDVIDNEPGHLVIAPFQAFMVRVTPGSLGNHTYQFHQDERTRTTNVPFYRTNSENTLKLELDYNGIKDMTRIAFNPSGTVAFDDEYDANKYNGGAGRPTLYTTVNTATWFAINTLPLLKEVTTVPMGLRPEVNGTMSITAQGIETFDPTTYIYLEDKKTGQWHNLRDGAYTFTTTKADVQSRFVVHFTPPATVLTTDAGCDQSGIINIEQPGSASWNYKVTDQSNAVLSSGTLNSGNPVAINANAGMYTLTLTDNLGYVVVKNIQVGGSQPVVAAFAASSHVVQAQDNVTFTSSSAATTYTWDFGDGTTGTGPVVNHVYATEGAYVVTLTVTSESGCTSGITRSITVTSKAITGTDEVADNKLAIWSNDNRVYVDFTKLGKVEAEIELYNILGQLISREKFGRSSIYNKPVLNTEAAYIVVKVKNNGIITTAKVFISNAK